MDAVSVMFSLIRCGLWGTPIDEETKNSLNEETFETIRGFSVAHDLGHIIEKALIDSGLSGDNIAANKLNGAMLLAVFRYERINHELKRLCQVLEDAKVPFIPLKGSVIRKLYPEPWLRTSCDIDILVHEEDLDDTIKLLADKCGYKYIKKSAYDVMLHAPNDVCIELHYKLIEGGCANEASAVLETVWERVCVREGYQYWHEMPDELFYFHHIAHMAKHFEHGGCGIRSFIDLWLLDKMESIDQTKRDMLLEQGKLLRFSQAARRLNDVWFDGAPLDAVSQQMENFVLYGGAYGSGRGRVTIGQQRRGGRVKYALYRIFAPYEKLKYHYPILQKHPWLTPFMQVRRWLEMVFNGRVGWAIKELSYNQSISKTQAEEIQIFLEEIGL